MPETHNSITNGSDPPNGDNDQHQNLNRTVDPFSCYDPFTSCSDPSLGLGAQDSNNFDLLFDSLTNIDTFEDDAWTPLKFLSQEDELQLKKVCNSLPDNGRAVIDQKELINKPKKSKKRKQDNNDLSSTVSAAAFSLTSASSSGQRELADGDDEEEEEDEFSSRNVENNLQFKSDHDGASADSTGEIQEPVCGMLFSSEEEAYSFYNSYARRIGFSVRKGKVQRSKNGNITKRYMFCSRQGYRSDTQFKKTTTYKRKETRTGCEAQIHVALQNGKWKITKFSKDHNHQLAKTLEDHSVVRLESEDEMSKDTSSTKYTEHWNMDCSNFLGDKDVTSLKTDDVQGLIDYFRYLQVEDPSFFYTIQFDANGHVKNFFWRDGRSRIDYDYFGDVMIVDTTFRMDKYGVICAPLLGVNHHRQFILFGCALLQDEGTDSFMWLFDSFVETMCRKQPETVFTDEGQGITEAIRAALPKAKHRLAKWNIQKNAQKRLSAYYMQPGFATLFDECIFGCRTEQQLKSQWESLLKRFDLQANPWLNTLYRSREMWSNAHMGKSFDAGLECYNNIKNIFHNLIIKTECSLRNLVLHYSEAAEKLRREEFNEDCRCNRTMAEMILHNTVEKQAASMYTGTMFKIFQREQLNCLSVAIEEIDRDRSNATFKLTEEGNKESFVKFGLLDSSVSCTCKKYESLGILCVHCLKVLNAKNIFHIPPQYMMKRWTKSAKDTLQADDQESRMPDKEKSPAGLLMRKALNVITKSVAVKESREIVEEYLDMALERVDNILMREISGHQTAEVEAFSEHNYGLGNAPEEARNAISEPAWSNELGKVHTSSFLSQRDCGIDTRNNNRDKGKNGESEVDSGSTLSRAFKEGDNMSVRKKCRYSKCQQGSQQNNVNLGSKQDVGLLNAWKLHPLHLDILLHKKKASEMEQMNLKLMEENYRLLTEQNKYKEMLELARKGEKHEVDRSGGCASTNNSPEF